MSSTDGERLLHEMTKKLRIIANCPEHSTDCPKWFPIKSRWFKKMQQTDTPGRWETTWLVSVVWSCPHGGFMTAESDLT